MANGVVRRDVLLAGVALAAASASDVLSSQGALPAPAVSRTRGPSVWLDMDQAQLDAAYDQVMYAPNQPQVLKRYASNSESNRSRLGNPRRYGYGPTSIEALDIYASSDAPGSAPINVFLHGGAWRHGLAKDYAFPAEMFVRAGAHLVIPDFVWVQDADGNLMTMAEQVRRAIAWVYRNAGSFGGDPTRLYLSGHSSGAHLAAVALTTDWQNDFGMPADTVKGALCCSGIYDLAPVRRSSRSNYVRFSDEIEDALSPQRHVETMNAPLIVAYGSLETPEFQRQGRDFAAALRSAGKPVQLLVGEGYNHFEVIETLANPYGLLGRAVRTQMNIP